MWIGRQVAQEETEQVPFRLPSARRGPTCGVGELGQGRHRLPSPLFSWSCPYLCYMSAWLYTDFLRDIAPFVKFQRNWGLGGGRSWSNRDPFLCTQFNLPNKLRSLYKNWAGQNVIKKKDSQRKTGGGVLFTFLMHSNTSYCGRQTGKKRTHFMT